MKVTLTLDASLRPLKKSELPGTRLCEATTIAPLSIVTFDETAVQIVPVHTEQFGAVAPFTE